jgi:DUF1365 family protein
MRSAVYEGWISHRRHETTEHAFRYRLALPLIDLDELDEVCSLHPLWSARGPNAAWIRPGDFLGPSSSHLRSLSHRSDDSTRARQRRTVSSWADGVRDLVDERLGRRPAGSVALLASPRTWGWLANPLAAYYCRDADGSLDAVVLEVTNTPWHERHHYVVGGAGDHELAKAMHVSPFFGMDHTYRLRVNDPGELLSLRLDNHTVDAAGGDVVAFEAVLSLRRRAMTRAALGRVLWRFPLQPQRVSAGIYAHALALAAKGVRVHAHPDRAPAPNGGPNRL